MPKRSASKIHRSGFTLVELLVVVGIVAILAALGIPAVMRTIKSTQASAAKLEVDTLSQALEDYRTKYGEYPPDGSSWAEFQRHCRKAFPGILTSELALFNSTISPTFDPSMLATSSRPSQVGAGPSVAVTVHSAADSIRGTNGNSDRTCVMEPAEALVFFLGGFSNDPQRPFTGPGGPFVFTKGHLHYNMSRSNAIFDFDATRLTTVTVTYQDTPTPLELTESNDEDLYPMNYWTGGNVIRDILPTYLSKYNKAPIAYFNSRTYVFTDPTSNPAGSNVLLNRFATGEEHFGSAFPYLSNSKNTTVSPAVNFFSNKDSFQLITAGLDGKFNESPSTYFFSYALAVAADSGLVFPNNIVRDSRHPAYDNAVNFVDVSSIGDAARKVEANN